MTTPCLRALFGALITAAVWGVLAAWPTLVGGRYGELDHLPRTGMALGWGAAFYFGRELWASCHRGNIEGRFEVEGLSACVLSVQAFSAVVGLVLLAAEVCLALTAGVRIVGWMGERLVLMTVVLLTGIAGLFSLPVAGAVLGWALWARWRVGSVPLALPVTAFVVTLFMASRVLVLVWDRIG